MKLLITGAWNDGKNHIAELEAMGHTVVFLQQESGALPCPAEEIEGVICNGLFLYHSLENFTALRYIQLTSAGYDRVPLEKIRERGIDLHNAGDVYSIPMAEFAVGGVLQLYKRFGAFRENQKLCRWEKLRDLQEIAGKTVCIIGCGNVGQACAKRFAAFDARVVGITAHPREIDGFETIYGAGQMEDVLWESDIVVLTLPLTEETCHLINEHRLRAMKDTAVLVNISRGGVVDTQALIKALEEEWISGAVLDVFEEEPLPAGSALWRMENVILTPHNSFVGQGNAQRLTKRILGQLNALAED